MYKILLPFALLLLLPGIVSAEENFATEQEKVGYAIGMNIGMNMKQQQLDVDAEQVVAGLKAALSGEETLLSQQEMAQILTAFQQKMQMEQVQKQAAEATKNKKLADEFLAANAEKEGVITLDSGLQYKVLKSGDGESPQADSKVKVNYIGTLTDGTEFDSSYKRGEPATFPVNGVIPGWTEALQLMQEGDKWQLAIPPQLAYAEKGAPPVIPPNSALVFEVELLEVLDSAAAEADKEADEG
jgi:FKBP-type peptidyl-prolyl cis-trans isomerase FklB